LNGSEIQRACEAGLVKIDPFSAERIKVTGYQLSLGHEAVMRGDRLKVTEQSGFILGVGSLAVISSLETVVLPQWLMGRIVAHHGSGHELTVYSTTIDPGFKGNILVGVENKMQYLPLIKPGTPFATLELSLINVPPSSFLAS
jgi:deoxycytidine triphosphate deaminase